MNMNPVLKIEREPWSERIILREVNYGVYICSCSFRYEEYRCKTKHDFFYEIHFKTLHQSKYCGYLIDNRAETPICVMEDNVIETKLNLKHALKNFFGGLCNVEYVYKITPC